MKRSQTLIISFLTILGILLEGSYLRLSTQEAIQASPAITGTSGDFQAFVPGEILLKFHANVTLNQIRAMNEARGMTILEMIPERNIYRLRVSRPVRDAVAFAQSQPFVEYARPNYIFAEVGGETITLLDMETIIEQIPLFLRQQYTLKRTKESLLRSLVEDGLFAKAAREENLDEIPEVKRRINAAIEKTLAHAYLRRIEASILVSEKELRDYYEGHLNEFRKPEQIKFRQIRVKTEKEAEEILVKIKAGAETDKIARGRSTDAPVLWSREWGWIGRGRIDPKLEKAAFALDKGEISGRIKARSGYHIIKVEDKRGPVQQAFSEVRDRIKQKLQDRKKGEITKEKTKELKEKYGTKLHTEFLSEIKVDTTGKTDQRDLIRTLQEMLKRRY